MFLRIDFFLITKKELRINMARATWSQDIAEQRCMLLCLWNIWMTYFSKGTSYPWWSGETLKMGARCTKHHYTWGLEMGLTILGIRSIIWSPISTAWTCHLFQFFIFFRLFITSFLYAYSKALSCKSQNYTFREGGNRRTRKLTFPPRSLK